jgi:hypothetical protein
VTFGVVLLVIVICIGVAIFVLLIGTGGTGGGDLG